MGRYVSGSELILKEGVTTSNGNAGGTTLIDASLIGKPNYPTGLQVRILSGTYQLITRTIQSFNTVTGTITVPAGLPFPGQIVAGTGYVIMGVTATSSDVLDIAADVGDASASALGSLYGILGNPSASLATTILDGIDARANNPTLNALLGVTDAAGRSINGNIGDFQAQTNLQTLLASLGIPDVAAKPLYTCLITDRLDNATYGLSAIETLVDDLETRLTAARAGYLDNIAATAAGRAQIATATIDLNQAAATYDLFTGTTQNVLVEKLVIRMPDLAAGGALTSISIQTDDSTPQVFISAALGAVANLTAQAQLSSDAPVIVTTGKKIRLTIAGGAHGVAYSCTVTVMYRSVVAGGYLA